MLRRSAQRLHSPLAALASAESPTCNGQIGAAAQLAQSLTQHADVSSGSMGAAMDADANATAAAQASLSHSESQRRFRAPEFTAAGGLPPIFTAGPDPRQAAGATRHAGAGPRTEQGGAAGADDRSDDWSGDVDAVLDRVQEAALNHVVCFSIRQPHLPTSTCDWTCYEGRSPQRWVRILTILSCRGSTAGRMLLWWLVPGTWACHPPSLAPCKRAAPTLLRCSSNQ